jgi:hypothetical protein
MKSRMIRSHATCPSFLFRLRSLHSHQWSDDGVRRVRPKLATCARTARVRTGAWGAVHGRSTRLCPRPPRCRAVPTRRLGWPPGVRRLARLRGRCGRRDSMRYEHGRQREGGPGRCAGRRAVRCGRRLWMHERRERSRSHDVSLRSDGDRLDMPRRARVCRRQRGRLRSLGRGGRRSVRGPERDRLFTGRQATPSMCRHGVSSQRAVSQRVPLHGRPRALSVGRRPANTRMSVGKYTKAPHAART